MFGATNIAKNNDNSKYVYGCCGIAYDEAGSWSFGNDFCRNVLIFGVDNSSSSQIDNLKNNYLVLGERPTDDISGSVGTAEKMVSINFSKDKILLLHYNVDSSFFIC